MIFSLSVYGARKVARLPALRWSRLRKSVQAVVRGETFFEGFVTDARHHGFTKPRCIKLRLGMERVASDKFGVPPCPREHLESSYRQPVRGIPCSGASTPVPPLGQESAGENFACRGFVESGHLESSIPAEESLRIHRDKAGLERTSCWRDR